jgi:hypothetical protein
MKPPTYKELENTITELRSENERMKTALEEIAKPLSGTNNIGVGLLQGIAQFALNGGNNGLLQAKT